MQRVLVVTHKSGCNFDVAMPEGGPVDFLEEIAVAALKALKSRGCNISRAFARVPGAQLRGKDGQNLLDLLVVDKSQIIH